MKRLILNILSSALTALLFSGCVKEENIFNMFDDVTVTFHDNSPFDIVDYKEVSDGDSVHIDFTVRSTKEDMYEVWLIENGQTSPVVKLPITDDTKRREFSSVFKLKADKRIGPTSYRVFPVNQELVYMGDGYKQLTVDVKSNFSFLTERHLFFPDSQMLKKCFISLRTGETFNYNEGKQNDSKIDLVVDTVWALIPNSNPKTYQRRFALFSPDAANKPLFSFYDMTSWNKRTTVFSVAEGTGPFVNLKTGAQIVKAATPKTASGLKGPILFNSGQMVYFKTQEGKYGALTAVVTNSYSRGENIELQIKITD